jgi:hypothetical protein
MLAGSMLRLSEAQRVELCYLVSFLLPESELDGFGQQITGNAMCYLEDAVKRDLGRTSIGCGTNEEAIHSFIMQASEEDILTLIEFVPKALVTARLYEPKGLGCSIAAWDLPELLEDALDRLNKFLESVSCEARFGPDGTFCRCPAIRVPEALS